MSLIHRGEHERENADLQWHIFYMFCSFISISGAVIVVGMMIEPVLYIELLRKQQQQREALMDSLFCCGRLRPRGLFSASTGSGSSEIRRSSSTVEHLEKSGRLALESKCKKQQVHKRTSWLGWTASAWADFCFPLWFHSHKILYYRACAREPPQRLSCQLNQAPITPALSDFLSV